MAGRQSGQETPFLPARLGGSSWAPQSGQRTPFLPARLGVLSWGPQSGQATQFLPARLGILSWGPQCGQGTQFLPARLGVSSWGPQSVQQTPFLPARLGVLSWGPQPGWGVPSHTVLPSQHPQPLSAGRQRLAGDDGGVLGCVTPSQPTRSPSVLAGGSDPNPLGQGGSGLGWFLTSCLFLPLIPLPAPLQTGEMEVRNPLFDDSSLHPSNPKSHQ